MYTSKTFTTLRFLAVGATIAATSLFASSRDASAQQHDSTHHATPAAEKPVQPKPTRPAAKRRAKPPAVPKRSAPSARPDTARAQAQPRDTAQTLADSMRTHHPDSAAVQPRDWTPSATPDSAHIGHDTTHMPVRDSTRAQLRDSLRAAAPDTMKMATRETMPMAVAMTGPLGISMERMGSGTTWIPDAVILPSRHYMVAGWMVMLHGFVFGQYDAQNGPRGRRQLGSLNWAMVMADREVGGGRLQFRFMPSLDPATVGRCGYPMLLQSGESCDGEPLVDRQHPHDFFMELSALYERELGSRIAILLYAAPAGEPALGPVAFMHRPSAMDEPQAPLGHHWQDATHISFGVVTAGLFTRTVRLEASAFNGHEPDEKRWNFDPITLNSYSARLSVNPSANWSLTAGYGRIDNPERTDPPETVRRLVISAMYGRAVGTDGQWASTVVYGRNAHEGDESSHSALVETEAVLDQRNTIFGRAEYVQKSSEELQLSGFADERLFDVGAISLGYIRELTRGRGVTLGVGARGTLNLVESALESSYGSRTPVGGMLFVRLRPFHSQPHQQMQMNDGSPGEVKHEH